MYNNENNTNRPTRWQLMSRVRACDPAAGTGTHSRSRPINGLSLSAQSTWVAEIILYRLQTLCRINAHTNQNRHTPVICSTVVGAQFICNNNTGWRKLQRFQHHHRPTVSVHLARIKPDIAFVRVSAYTHVCILVWSIWCWVHVKHNI